MACSSDFVGQYNIENLPQGSDISIPLNYKTGNPATTVDLSTYTAKLQVRQTYNTQVLIELNTSDSTITVDNDSPNITLIFSAAKTQNLNTYDNMIYDLEITSASGVVTRILEGTFSLSRQVTR